MSKPLTVLAAVDLNNSTTAVVRRAHQLAASCGGQLVLAHAVDWHTGYEVDHIPSHTPQQIASAMADEACQRLAKLAKGLGADQAQIWAVWGQPQRVVQAVAEAVNAEVVVVGTSGWLGCLRKVDQTPFTRPRRVVRVPASRHFYWRWLGQRVTRWMEQAFGVSS